jgi:hypothetical protein
MWSQDIEINGVRVVVGGYLSWSPFNGKTLSPDHYKNVVLDAVSIPQICKLDHSEIVKILQESVTICREVTEIRDHYDADVHQFDDSHQFMYVESMRIADKYQNIRDGIYSDMCEELRKKAIARYEKSKQPREKKPRKIECGYIYLLKNDKYFKIGKSKKPNERFEALQIASPHKIEKIKLFKINDYSFHEKQLHRICQERKHLGEWFALTGDDIEAISEYLLTNDGEMVA